jgi:hypothetical protein
MARCDVNWKESDGVAFFSQSFPLGQLGIRDAEKMGPSLEVLNAMVRGISIDEMLEMTEGNEIQQLREHRAAAIYGVASFARGTGKDTAKHLLAISNRRNLGSRQNSDHRRVSIK